MNIKRRHFTNVAAVIVLFVVFVFGSVDHATANFQRPQEEVTKNLQRVYEIGQEIGNPETLQAIMLQESGGYLIKTIQPPSKTRSYGIMQVQIVAARSMLSRNPELLELYFPDRKYRSLSDKEIVNLLVMDDDANMRIAAYHFKTYLDLCSGDWNKAVAAYNVGIGAVQRIPNPVKFGYVKAIKTRLQSIRSFNQLQGLELTEK